MCCEIVIFTYHEAEPSSKWLANHVCNIAQVVLSIKFIFRKMFICQNASMFRLFVLVIM